MTCILFAELWQFAWNVTQNLQCNLISKGNIENWQLATPSEIVFNWNCQKTTGMIVFRCFVLNTESCLAAVCMNNDNEPGKNNGHTHRKKRKTNKTTWLFPLFLLSLLEQLPKPTDVSKWMVCNLHPFSIYFSLIVCINILILCIANTDDLPHSYI